MSILSPEGVDPQSPFCDALDVTFPRELEPDVVDVLSPRLGGAIGCQLVREGLWNLSAVRAALPACLLGPGRFEAGWIVEPRRAAPTVKLDSKGSWCRVSFSGQAVGALRAQGIWVPLLADLSQMPVRVTRLDASLDMAIPGPDAVPVVAAEGQAGKIALGRKALTPQDVNWVRQIDRFGAQTGMVYLGDRRRREIVGRVYDKRNERDREGLDDLGPCTRVEIQCKAVGATLRDAAVPAGLFWAYGRAVVHAPDGAPDWSAGDLGWDAPAPLPPDYWRICERRVDTLTPELLALKRLSLQMGPYGPAMLLRRIADVLGLGHLVRAHSEVPA